MTASSSRRSAVSWLLSAGAAAALGFLAYRWGPWNREAVEGRGPWKLYLSTSPGSKPSPSDAVEPEAIWVALTALPPERLRNVVDELEAVIAILDTERDPFAVDLLDEEPEPIVRGLSRWFLPVLSAARALCAGHWSTPDGRLTVSVEREGCGPDCRVVGAWAGPGEEVEPLVMRARFIAWPISSALLIRCEGAERRREAAVALQRAIGSARSSFALVVDALAQGAEPSSMPALKRAELESIRSLAVKYREQSAGPVRSGKMAWLMDLCESAALVRPDRRSLPWLRLDPTELLLVPRLSVLSRRPAFVAEARASLQGLAAEIVNG